MGDVIPIKKPFESPVAFTAPCVRCGQPVEVSQFALETAKKANHILKARGEKLLRKRDIAMCPGCYETHHAKMWDEERRISANYEYLWRQFKVGWRKAGEDQRPSMVDDFLKNLGEYKGSYQALVTAWVSQMNSRKDRGKGGKKGKEAGF